VELRLTPSLAVIKKEDLEEMKIKKLKLFTNKLELEKIFYSQTLGFEIIESNSNYFTLKIGWSELTFEKTEKEYKYH